MSGRLKISGSDYLISGTLLESGGRTSYLKMYKRAYHSTRNPFSKAGRFTAVLPQVNGSSNPGGTGVAFVNVSKSGSFRGVGTLGDGSKLSLASYVSSENDTALYRKLYTRNATGWIGGIIHFGVQDNISSANGILHWFKGVEPREKRYPDGFDIQQPALLSPYSKPNLKAGEYVISDVGEGDANANLFLSDNRIGGNRVVTWTPKNKVSLTDATETERLSVRISTKTGSVTGYHYDTATKVRTNFKGAAYQEQDLVVGNYIGDAGTGYFEMSSVGAPGLEIYAGPGPIYLPNNEALGFGVTGYEGGLSEITLYATNNGTGRLHFRGQPTIESDHSEDFAVTGFSGGYLSPGETARIQVRFEPQTAGSKSAVLRLETNAEAANPFLVTLNGEAVPGSAGDGYAGDPLSGPGVSGQNSNLVDSSTVIYDVTNNGIYKGVVYESKAGGAAMGLASLKISSNKTTGFGLLSGSTKIGKLRLTLKGEILQSGAFSGDVTGKRAPDWTPNIVLHSSAEGQQLVGSLLDVLTGERYHFVAIPNRYSKRDNPFNDAGRYTGVIPATVEDFELEPGGHGYAWFNVSVTGTTRIAFFTPDRKKVTTSGILSQDQQMQLYAKTLDGVITFRETADISDVDGKLNWNVPANPKSANYSGGYRKVVDFVGSKYLAPATGVRVLPVFDSSNGLGIVKLQGIQLSEAKEVTLEVNNKFTYVPVARDRLVVSLSKKTGLVRGHWWDRDNGQPKRAFSGVAFQKQGGVFGSVAEGSTVGTMEIEPSP